MSERDAWLAEMWQPCRELPIGERLAKRENDAVEQALLAGLTGESGPESVELAAS